MTKMMMVTPTAAAIPPKKDATSNFLPPSGADVVDGVVPVLGAWVVTLGFRVVLTAGVVTLDVVTSGEVTLDVVTAGVVTLEVVRAGVVTLEVVRAGVVTLDVVTSGAVTLDVVTSGAVVVPLSVVTVAAEPIVAPEVAPANTVTVVNVLKHN